MRIDFRATEDDFPTQKFIRAVVTLWVQRDASLIGYLNQLRAFHGLPALNELTRNQVIQAIKQEMRDL